jgi:hypothetical protein
VVLGQEQGAGLRLVARREPHREAEGLLQGPCKLRGREKGDANQCVTISQLLFFFSFFILRPSMKSIAIADVTTAYNLYQKKDLLEWWNYKLCEEFDAIANTWLLALDAYIAQLAIEHELQSSF